MRHLMRFNERFDLLLTDLTDVNFDSWIRIEDNVKDIFVEYKDSHDLDVVVNRGFLPNTLIGLNDNVIEVKLFSQRGIKYDDISEEVDMVIEYINSLTDKEVKIYYELDRRGLVYEYSYLSIKYSFNTIRLYFVEIFGKLNESLDNKVIEDIKDIFVELTDQSINFSVTKELSEIVILIYKKKRDSHLDMNLIKDCVEMTKDYLSDFVDFTEFYRFGFVWEAVNTKISNQNTLVNYKSKKRDLLDYDKFPEDIHSDIETKFDLLYKFVYDIEGIKIVYKFNEN
jgi:hypothetical protein